MYAAAIVMCSTIDVDGTTVIVMLIIMICLIYILGEEKNILSLV